MSELSSGNYTTHRCLINVKYPANNQIIRVSELSPQTLEAMFVSVKAAASWVLAYRKHFVVDREEVTGGWRQVHNG
jgi:hypothetical protein